MIHKYTTLFLLSVSILLFSGLTSASAATQYTQDTTVTAEIVEGDLSMTQPENLNFSAVLNGKAQTLDLAPLHTTVMDYRSMDVDWELSIRSSNFESYASNYKLVVNDVEINSKAQRVEDNTDQAEIQALSLPVKVKISADAKAGSYTADLEWNLQPNTTHSMKE